MEKLRKVKKLCYGLMFVTLALVFLAYTLQSVAVGVVSLVFLAAMLAVFLMKYRCPHCRRHLGRMDGAEYCKYCGRRL